MKLLLLLMGKDLKNKHASGPETLRTRHRGSKYHSYPDSVLQELNKIDAFSGKNRHSIMHMAQQQSELMHKRVDTPGLCHIVHGTMELLIDAMEWMMKFTVFLSACCKLCTKQFMKQRLISTIFSSGPASGWRDRIQGFNSHVHRKRWGSVILLHFASMLRFSSWWKGTQRACTQKFTKR